MGAKDGEISYFADEAFLSWVLDSADLRSSRSWCTVEASEIGGDEFMLFGFFGVVVRKTGGQV